MAGHGLLALALALAATAASPAAADEDDSTFPAKLSLKLLGDLDGCLEDFAESVADELELQGSGWSRLEADLDGVLAQLEAGLTAERPEAPLRDAASEEAVSDPVADGRRPHRGERAPEEPEEVVGPAVVIDLTPIRERGGSFRADSTTTPRRADYTNR
ncbi:unnamed protein product [Prorocentrum cordatum]|uniref:Uncharacterized protein n=1 Tax=Prorocentrum cordatum TaxID=2364126 RepID=A0ABN9VTX5_9DINO|nr:unnamed protein product [Polarella glacialis]